MVHINFTGDFVINNIDNLSFSDELKNIFLNGDINITNFEAPVKSASSKPSHKSGPVLYQDEKSPRFLEDNGFNVITMANNHIMDYGEESLKYTINKFNKSECIGIGKFEDAYKITYINVDKYKIGVLGVAQYEFGMLTDSETDCYGVAWVSHPIIDELILDAKKQCDFIIMLPHVGLEMFNLPLPEVKTLYRHFIDIGADCVVGTHPHVIQPWETYKEKPIFYSLGNFLFDEITDNEHWYYGLIAQLTLSDNGLKVNTILTHYDTDKKEVSISNQTNYLEYLNEINNIFLDSKKYIQCINKHCLSLEAQYIDLYKMSGYFTPEFKKCIRIALGILKRKIMGIGPHKYDMSHFINNIRCETHRWVQSRIYELKYK